MEIIIIEEVRILVDEDMASYVKSHKWHISGRDRSVMRTIGSGNRKRHERLARIVMGLKEDDGSEVDHINRNTLDNRRENLRIVTTAQNQWNAKKRKDNKSGFRGVYQHHNTFVAFLYKHGKEYRVGSFSSAILAARARDRKALELHGEFAFTNFPREQYQSRRLEHDYYFSGILF